MRKIKFRAWDGKEIFYPTQLTFEGGYGWWVGKGRGISLEAQPHIELMQFTGLHDKNGVEIYEGDILMHDMASYFGEVKYYEGGFVVGATYSANCLVNYNTSKFARVIGNIHENPELLNKPDGE